MQFLPHIKCILMYLNAFLAYNESPKGLLIVFYNVNTAVLTAFFTCTGGLITLQLLINGIKKGLRFNLSPLNIGNFCETLQFSNVFKTQSKHIVKLIINHYLYNAKQILFILFLNIVGKSKFSYFTNKINAFSAINIFNVYYFASKTIKNVLSDNICNSILLRTNNGKGSIIPLARSSIANI